MAPSSPFIILTVPNICKRHLSVNNIWLECQIVNIENSAGRVDQNLPIQVLFGDSGRDVHSQIQHPASKTYENITLINLFFNWVGR